VLDAGEGPLDQCDALVGGEQVRGGLVLKQRQGRGQPVRGLLPIAKTATACAMTGTRRVRGSAEVISPFRS
jgi:hypothetical protein